VARWWLELSREHRDDLKWRARERGWGVAEWLCHLENQAFMDVFQAGGHIEANTIPETDEKITTMLELMHEPLGHEPPRRKLRERAFRFLYT
jgi:hypothetical protein